jgi:hypothetical protein
MSTLTYTTPDHAPAADAKPARRPFWSRVFDALIAAQQRRADREIARYLATHGHLLSDDAEREIMRRLAGGGRAL